MLVGDTTHLRVAEDDDAGLGGQTLHDLSERRLLGALLDQHERLVNRL